MKPRARQLGIPFEGETGPWNAISDVAGVEVGYATLISGEGRLQVGKGPVRTGVTAILPRGRRYDPPFAAWHTLNGNGEMTGTTWIEESGFLETPIFITNTHSVGSVRDGAVAWMYAHNYYDQIFANVFWSLPVVAETYDGRMNDINGFHIRQEHVFAALDRATSGPLAEGNVGGGAGMVLYQFKGGTGTASRRVSIQGRAFDVGVLVQANYGTREQLVIAGAPVGREIPELMPAFYTADAFPGASPASVTAASGPASAAETGAVSPPDPSAGAGSIIAILATDAPLLPHQLKRLAMRIPLGIARLGGIGSNFSGDIFLAFSTANPGASRRSGIAGLEMLPNDQINPLFIAAIQATEEAIVNTLVAAETMVGINGSTVHALPHERLVQVLKKYRPA